MQIDHDATRIGLRFPVEVGLVGDARETLAALLRVAAAARTTAVSRAKRSAAAPNGAALLHDAVERPGRR